MNSEPYPDMTPLNAAIRIVKEDMRPDITNIYESDLLKLMQGDSSTSL